MTEKQQKKQTKLPLTWKARGEAPDSQHAGTESVVATDETTSPMPESAMPDLLMEELASTINLKEAYFEVRSNKGSPGIDGMTVDDYGKYYLDHHIELSQSLLNGTYSPKPVKRVEIPKPGGGTRKLGIPTVQDRVVQQAILRVVQRYWDHTFSESSYGFRPNRNQHQAIRQAQKYVSGGQQWVVDMDLEKFFDRVNHDILMALVAKKIKDKRLLKLLRAFLNAGIMEDGVIIEEEEGTPQGGPLSPWLSNVMLNELDRELEKRTLHFVRYADDCNIYVASERAGIRVLAGITQFLAKKLKLKVNEEKSAVARPWERKFLGFTFTRKDLKVQVAPKSIDRAKDKIRKITDPLRGDAEPTIIAELTSYLLGWQQYYSICETSQGLRNLDGWIRRRLRNFLWLRWRNGSNRERQLLKRGVNPRLAKRTAHGSKGSWRMSGSKAVQTALPNKYFAKLGVPCISIGGTR